LDCNHIPDCVFNHEFEDKIEKPPPPPEGGKREKRREVKEVMDLRIRSHK
jgi:hypothetical protein